MVDPINPSGQVQSISPTYKSQKSADSQKQEESKSTSVDEVSLSEEALTLADVEKTAQQAASQVSDDQSAALSNDKTRLNALV